MRTSGHTALSHALFGAVKALGVPGRALAVRPALVAPKDVDQWPAVRLAEVREGCGDAPALMGVHRPCRGRVCYWRNGAFEIEQIATNTALTSVLVVAEDLPQGQVMAEIALPTVDPLPKRGAIDTEESDVEVLSPRLPRPVQGGQNHVPVLTALQHGFAGEAAAVNLIALRGDDFDLCAVQHARPDLRDASSRRRRIVHRAHFS